MSKFPAKVLGSEKIKHTFCQLYCNMPINMYGHNIHVNTLLLYNALKTIQYVIKIHQHFEENVKC